MGLILELGRIAIILIGLSYVLFTGELRYRQGYVLTGFLPKAIGLLALVTLVLGVLSLVGVPVKMWVSLGFWMMVFLLLIGGLFSRPSDESYWEDRKEILKVGDRIIQYFPLVFIIIGCCVFVISLF